MEVLANHPNIEIIDEEYCQINGEEITLIASGPLTIDNLQTALRDFLGKEYFYFFDAAAPIITKDSIDFKKAYYKFRYDLGAGKDYINCPLTKAEFDNWVNELVNAEVVQLHDFEKRNLFWRLYANWSNG